MSLAIPLANRLAVHILHDLNRNCPRTILALYNWLDHVGFWLAELGDHARNNEQIAYMISLLALNLSSVMGCSIQDARLLLRDEMVIKQAERLLEVSK
jgi:hypothetical protein